jgi:hypothetical protein
MHLQVCGGEEKGRSICARSFASPGQAGRGGAWRGEAMGVGVGRACE